MASYSDITERIQAQRIQESCNLQLQEKVSELEAFSYGIAHDLRSPLVSIEGFSRLLRTDCPNKDIEKVYEDIRLIESGIGKMKQLINRTLEYSRASRLVKPTTKESFTEIVNDVIGEFNGQLHSIGATVSLAEKFPKIFADRVRIREALSNLIQNSIKYRDEARRLKLDISYKLLGNEVAFFVRDNAADRAG